MHIAQVNYCHSVRKRFPEYFTGKRVLDVGSMDINGNNRYLFTDCEYTGLDIGAGKNVDIVMPVHEHLGEYDVVISTEMLEHDRHWKESIEAMHRLAVEFVLFTCAAPGRQTHGTHDRDPAASPFTHDYYRNLSEDDVREVIEPLGFAEVELTNSGNDLYFYGKK